ncbi:MAG: hypothetical protein IPK97_12970 [Ahniella sp.]|nr:hypothetical protein [Ahniella sp.]
MIELMVAMVLGLIVIGSATALLVLTLDANGRTLRATRLTQEMRAVSDIVTREVRRARYYPDAMANFGENGDDDDGDGQVTSLDDTFATNPFDRVEVVPSGTANDQDPTTVDGECIRFAYGNAQGGAFRSISRAQVGGRGVIRLGRAEGTAPGCGFGVDLTSPQVDVTMLAFNFDEERSDPAFDMIRITIQSRLVADQGVFRRSVETVRLRSPKLPRVPTLPPPAG